MGYCTNCGQHVDDTDKFCRNCGVSLIKNDQHNHQHSNKGKIYKCPNCGEVIDAFTSRCPACGCEIRDINVLESIKELAKQLEDAKSDNEKANIIRLFPIPNTREDILEFFILASSNVEEKLDGDVSSAWQAKLDQVVQKARIALTDESEIERIEHQYAELNKKLKKERTKLASSKKRLAVAQIIPTLPRLIIVYAWLISIFILIPHCYAGINQNSYQLMLIIDFLLGTFFIPLLLKCEEALPKMVTAAGIALSVIILILICKTNEVYSGINIYHVIFVIWIICIVVMIRRIVKYQRKSILQSSDVNGLTFIITISSFIILLAIFGIGTIVLHGGSNTHSTENSTNSTNSVSNNSHGIHTYEIRNYVGKNVASVGSFYNNLLVDKYGDGKIRIVLETEDGMIIANNDTERRKQYYVVDQNIPAGTNFKIVNEKYSNGTYSSLVDYQGYEEIVLYVAPVGTTSYTPEYTSISPAVDHYKFYIRDYTGRNAASFGWYRGTSRVDQYGNALLKFNYTSTDGTFVDATDIDTLKGYKVVSQSIEPNSELKLEYETDSKGEEYDSLIQYQNYEDINLVVEPIDESIVLEMPTLKVEESDTQETESSSEVKKTNLTIKYKVLSGGNAEITGFVGEGSHVTIDDKIDGYKVVSIGDSAFKDCTTLEWVSNNADIETIGEYAFAGCTSLDYISISRDITEIGAHAFEGCTNLSSISINGYTTIGEYAFADCENLGSVFLSRNIERIKSHAFDGCLNLDYVSRLYDTIVEKDAFINCPKLDRPIQE